MKNFLKRLYHLLPFKKQLFILIRSCCKPSASVYQHLHFVGVFNVTLRGKKVFKLFHHGNIEENEIFWNGLDKGWEQKSIDLWLQLCPHHTTILDVGANSGLYGIAAKAFNPQAEVHCFEPVVGTVEYLMENSRINNFDIGIHAIGLSDYDGIADVYLPDERNFAYSVTVNQNTVAPHRSSRKISISVQRIDTLIEQQKISLPTLIKLDVERHEYEVLMGMGKWLRELQPDLLIEVLDDEQAVKLQSVFEGMDYLYFNIDDQKNTVRQTNRIEKSDYWNYLVCKPETAKMLKLIP